VQRFPFRSIKLQLAAMQSQVYIELMRNRAVLDVLQEQLILIRSHLENRMPTGCTRRSAASGEGCSVPLVRQLLERFGK
jgi:hypothetical protein